MIVLTFAAYAWREGECFLAFLICVLLSNFSNFPTKKTQHFYNRRHKARKIK